MKIQILRLIIPLSLVFCLLCIPTTGFSYLIVDTGQPPTVRSGASLGDIQSLAVGLSLNQSHYISAIKGWMYGFGTLSLSLYREASGLPDPNNMLYRTVLDIPFSDVPGRPTEWKSGENLGWLLGQESYWTAFEVMEFDTFHGAMPNEWLSEPLNAPTAVNGYPDYVWHENNPYHGLGFRIEGNIVPIPGAI